MKNLKIDEEQARKRLDIFASEQLPMVSRAFIQKLCNDGRILVNKESERPGYRLRLGDEVLVNFEPEDLEKIADIELPILYEDNNVLVMNKPVGVISHARGRYWNEPSVASFVRQVTGQQGERAGIVHRLDRATSGVMICAKNQESLSYLQKQFGNLGVKKTYFAVVKGQPEPASAVIDMPIERNPKAPSTFRVGANGKIAKTTYETIKTNDKFSLLKLTPETGRTHQLRVHLNKIGHPIVGDTLYDGQEAERLYLHAESLEITMPLSHERKIFNAPLPEEFSKLVD